MRHQPSKRRQARGAPEFANVVGGRLRQIRSDLGLTQEQLAARCQVLGLDMSRGTLAKIEARVRLVKACELFIIAKVLKLPMEHFYPPGYGTAPAKGKSECPGEASIR